MDPPTPTISKRAYRSILIAAAFSVICVIQLRKELNRMFDIDQSSQYQSMSAARLPACTIESPDWPKPETLPVTRQKYNSAVTAMEVLGFIIAKLDSIGAPVIPMFGTALHEYRNGTDGPCLIPNYKDKDFDIAVFAEHYHFITLLEAEILQKFGWKFMINDRRRYLLFTTIQPVGAGETLQIDIYGFVCNESNDLVYFPWDQVSIARNAFLPAKKHKLILSQIESGNNSTNATKPSSHWYSNDPGFYRPYNPPCLLHNIYGPDYMTPKSGPSSQAKWGGLNGRPAFGNPECNTTLTAVEEHEMERQLSFCSGQVPGPNKVYGISITN